MEMDPFFIPVIYKDCHVCSQCEECRNGVGLKSPPGLRGHSMIMGESGFFIHGGTQWSMTNFTVQDMLNEKLNIFSDKCRAKINYVNEMKSYVDNWKPLKVQDVGT